MAQRYSLFIYYANATGNKFTYLTYFTLLQSLGNCIFPMFKYEKYTFPRHFSLISDTFPRHFRPKSYTFPRFPRCKGNVFIVFPCISQIKDLSLHRHCEKCRNEKYRNMENPFRFGTLCKGMSPIEERQI